MHELFTDQLGCFMLSCHSCRKHAQCCATLQIYIIPNRHIFYTRYHGNKLSVSVSKRRIRILWECLLHLSSTIQIMCIFASWNNVSCTHRAWLYLNPVHFCDPSMQRSICHIGLLTWHDRSVDVTHSVSQVGGGCVLHGTGPKRHAKSLEINLRRNPRGTRQL